MTRYYEHNLIVTATREDGSAAEYSVAPDSALIDSDLGPANSIEEAKLIIEDAIGDGTANLDGGFSVHGAFTNIHTDHTEASIVGAIADHPNNAAAAALQNHVHDSNHTVSSGTQVDGDAPVLEIDAHSDHTHGGAGGAAQLTHNVAGGADLVHTATDNRPKYYVMAALQRCDQRV